MKYELKCEHDQNTLVKEETIAGIIYRCKKCNCVYRLMIAHNDNICYNKRFPVKNTVSLAEVKRQQRKKKRT